MFMKKLYNSPEVEIEWFSVRNCITTSGEKQGGGLEDGNNELEY